MITEIDVFTKLTCEGEKTNTDCGNGYVISIQKASFGRNIMIDKNECHPKNKEYKEMRYTIFIND